MHTVVSGADDLPRDIPVVKTYDRVTAAFPGEAAGARVVVEAKDVSSGPVAAAIAELRSEAEADPAVAGEVTVKRSADDTRRGDRHPHRRQRQRCRGDAGDGAGPRAAGAGGVRRSRRSKRQRHRRCRPVEGLQRSAGPAPAARLRLRARDGVPVDAGHLPLDRRPDQGDRAEPALGRSRLRSPGAGLPEGARRVPAGLPLQRRHQLLAAAVPVRDPLRALDGLPRADPQPGPRGGRQGA